MNLTTNVQVWRNSYTRVFATLLLTTVNKLFLSLSVFTEHFPLAFAKGTVPQNIVSIKKCNISCVFETKVAYKNNQTKKGKSNFWILFYGYFGP